MFDETYFTLFLRKDEFKMIILVVFAEVMVV
jgi:hypothetical protein